MAIVSLAATSMTFSRFARRRSACVRGSRLPPKQPWRPRCSAVRSTSAACSPRFRTAPLPRLLGHSDPEDLPAERRHHHDRPLLRRESPPPPQQVGVPEQAAGFPGARPGAGHLGRTARARHGRAQHPRPSTSARPRKPRFVEMVD
ncbi:hypothetical protein Zm00014a_029406 [Zea mays]|uniref:Uncharacterized protein n=1 Tax=Zea mays TaxID=4577 RepID=A0A3L6FTA8_MAIZE|nr:hypothetical protein Zm00014a_029406 [Zea mays]